MPTYPKHETPVRYTPNPEIKLVLNGGSAVLDSATVPITWHFSAALIAKHPRFVLICDHEHPLEAYANAGFQCSSAYRRVFNANDLMGFIQLHRSGRHHFVAFVFYGDEDFAEGRVRQLLKHDSGTWFDEQIIVSSILTNNANGHYSNCEMTTVAFEAPRELFAAEPRTAFGKALRAWTNRWFRERPSDECHYRRRKMIAYTIQPPLVLIAGFLRTVYTLIGALLLLFAGWYPINVLENIRNGWAHPSNFRFGLTKYREWRRRTGTSYFADKKDEFIPRWAVPTVVIGWTALFAFFGIVLLCLGYYAVLHWEGYGSILLFFLLIAGCVIGMFFASVSVVKRIRKRLQDSTKFREGRLERQRKRKAEREALWKQQQEQREKSKIEFLSQHASLLNVPKTADLRTVIPFVAPFTKFRLSYEGLKAKVCRPYER